MDLTCALSAFLFFLSNLLRLISFFKESNRGHFDFELWKALDPDYIKQEWQFRQEHRGLMLSTVLINALAWFTFSIPIVQLSWVLSRGGKRKIWIHAFMVALALGGSIAELVSGLFLIGTSTTATWISREFNLDSWLSDQDDLGWRVLEIAYFIARGMVLWIDAFEWLALFGILTLTFVSVRSMTDHNNVFGKKWAWLGLVIGLLSFVDFAADVLRLMSWRTFMVIAAFISLINTLILLPLWLLLLGRTLPLAAPKYTESEDNIVNSIPAEQAQVS